MIHFYNKWFLTNLAKYIKRLISQHLMSSVSSVLHKVCHFTSREHVAYATPRWAQTAVLHRRQSGSGPAGLPSYIERLTEHTMKSHEHDTLLFWKCLFCKLGGQWTNTNLFVKKSIYFVAATVNGHCRYTVVNKACMGPDFWALAVLQGDYKKLDYGPMFWVCATSGLTIRALCPQMLY